MGPGGFLLSVLLLALTVGVCGWVELDGLGPAARTRAIDAANGQPPRLVLELEAVDRTTFVQSLAVESRPELRPAIGTSAAVTTTAVVATFATVADATGTAKAAEPR